MASLKWLKRVDRILAREQSRLENRLLKAERRYLDTKDPRYQKIMLDAQTDLDELVNYTKSTSLERRTNDGRGGKMTREEAIFVLECVEAHGLATEAKRMAIEALKAEPIKHGRWVESWGGKWHSCSICEAIPPFNFDGVDLLTNYCPNCGAKMDL